MYYLAIFLKTKTGKPVKHVELFDFDDFWWWDRVKWRLKIKYTVTTYDPIEIGVWALWNYGNAKIVALLPEGLGEHFRQDLFTRICTALLHNQNIESVWNEMRQQHRQTIQILTNLKQTQTTLHRTMNTLLQRGEKLGKLEEKGSDLVEQSRILKENAKYRCCSRLCW